MKSMQLEAVLILIDLNTMFNISPRGYELQIGCSDVQTLAVNRVKGVHTFIVPTMAVRGVHGHSNICV